MNYDPERERQQTKLHRVSGVLKASSTGLVTDAQYAEMVRRGEAYSPEENLRRWKELMKKLEGKPDAK